MMVLAKTDIGKAREINQDCYYISDESDNLKLYIIADGMGGYSGGEVASNLAVLTIKKYLEDKINNKKNMDEEKITKILKDSFEVAHSVIYDKAQKEKDLEEMGTTLDVCLIYNNKVYIAHIGDSRVYKINILRDNTSIEQITVDHSYVQKLLKEGSITKEEAYNHPRKNMLMKALGGNDKVEEPDVFVMELDECETLMMCTDGLTNMLRDNEILEIISKDINLANKNLIQAANDKGGLDNITVIIINTKILRDEG